MKKISEIYMAVTTALFTVTVNTKSDILICAPEPSPNHILKFYDLVCMCIFLEYRSSAFLVFSRGPPLPWVSGSSCVFILLLLTLGI